MVSNNLYLQCSWILHALPCFYVEFFFLLNNVLYIFFQHFKDANPLFSGSSTLFLQISFIFFYFQDFLFVFGFRQLFQSDQCLMTQDECMDTSMWSIQSAILMYAFKNCHVCFQHPYYNYLYKTATCQLFCISKKNIPLSEKIIVWTQIFFMYLFQNNILQQINLEAYMII